VFELQFVKLLLKISRICLDFSLNKFSALVMKQSLLANWVLLAFHFIYATYILSIDLRPTKIEEKNFIESRLPQFAATVCFLQCNAYFSTNTWLSVIHVQIILSLSGHIIGNSFDHGKFWAYVSKCLMVQYLLYTYPHKMIADENFLLFVYCYICVLSSMRQ
jgi:hypothetical protein